MFSKKPQAKGDTLLSILTNVDDDGSRHISPGIAQRIIAESNWPGQRKTAPWHITLLASIMRRGDWNPGSQIAFCLIDGKLYLVNGQHRLLAVVEAGVTENFQILIQEVATLDDVAKIYHSHDVVNRSRSVADIINATDICKMTGLPKAYISRLYGAAGLLSNNLAQPNYHTDPQKARDVNFRIDTISGWVKEATAYFHIAQQAEPNLRQRLLSSGVIATALHTLRFQPAKAVEFWNGVAKDDGLRRGDPRKTLVTDLLTRNLGSGTLKQRVAAPAAAWNAFYEKRDLKIIKVYDEREVKLAGSAKAVA